MHLAALVVAAAPRRGGWHYVRASDGARRWSGSGWGDTAAPASDPNRWPLRHAPERPGIELVRYFVED
jgi:hypothetical protein